MPEQINHAARLVDIERELTIWQRSCGKARSESEQRKLISQAQAWSDEVLKMSGLLNKE
jgi:hypothetical protein